MDELKTHDDNDNRDDTSIFHTVDLDKNNTIVYMCMQKNGLWFSTSQMCVRLI